MDYLYGQYLTPKLKFIRYLINMLG